MIGPPSLRINALEELFQWGHQHRGLALPEEVHEHHLFLEGQVEQAQAVQHCGLQVLLTWEEKQSMALKQNTHFTLRNICPLTREWRVGVQLAYALLQQAEAERQHGRVVEQVEHDAVARGLVGRDQLTLKFHHLLDKVRRLGLIVPQQFVKYFQRSVSNFPL